jgi:Icc-related predicted phosphoesterase
MRIQLVSDLHLEFSGVKITNTSNVDALILGGDITIAKKNNYQDFFASVSDQYKDIIYIAGNHEYYGGSWDNTIDVLREMVSPYPNIHFLEDQYVDIDQVRFVGSTLWTDMHKGDPATALVVEQSLNDYRVIFNRGANRNLSANDTMQKHHDSMAFIKKTVEQDPDRTYVMVSHHCPTPASTHPDYAGARMNGGFASDLSSFILEHPQIKLWTCGHTHRAHWYYLGETLVACNPRGYDSVRQKENPRWTPNLIIDLDQMPNRQLVNQRTFVDYF